LAMRGPLVVLGLLALGAGAAGPLIPGFFSTSIGTASEAGEHAPLFVPLLGSAAAVAGLVVAWVGYERRGFDPGRIRAGAGPLVTLLERRWYVDDVFEAVYRFVYLGISSAVGWADRYLVDGVVNAVSWTTWRVAGWATAIQTGRVQDALFATVAGLLVLAWLAWAR